MRLWSCAPPVGYQASRGFYHCGCAHPRQNNRRKPSSSMKVLITNEIRYGAQAIDQNCSGGMSDDPDPGPRGDAGGGRGVSTCICRNAGSYENARALERDRLVTDENGYAKTKAPALRRLCAGTDQRARRDMSSRAPILFEIDGTEDHPQPAAPDALRPAHPLPPAPDEDGQRKQERPSRFPASPSSSETRRESLLPKPSPIPTRQETDTFVTDETGSVTLPETRHLGPVLRWRK